MSAGLQAFLSGLDRWEGGYSRDPADRGGETIFGISRAFHPTWPGWSRVDLHKQGPGFPKRAEIDDELRQLARDFYRDHYWTPVQGEQLYSVSRQVALETADWAVNSGIRTAARGLQRSLNLGNQAGVLWGDIAEDGRIGPATIDALHRSMTGTSSRRTLLRLRVVRGAFYLDIATRRQSQERFLDGWLARLMLEPVPRRIA